MHSVARVNPLGAAGRLWANVMTLHKLAPGSGYTYLTRQVAVHDATELRQVGLASYYEEKGEAPGRWLGTGPAGLDLEGRRCGVRGADEAAYRSGPPHPCRRTGRSCPGVGWFGAGVPNLRFDELAGDDGSGVQRVQQQPGAGVEPPDPGGGAGPDPPRRPLRLRSGRTRRRARALPAVAGSWPHMVGKDAADRHAGGDRSGVASRSAPVLLGGFTLPATHAELLALFPPEGLDRGPRRPRPGPRRCLGRRAHRPVGSERLAAVDARHRAQGAPHPGAQSGRRARSAAVHRRVGRVGRACAHELLLVGPR